MIIPVAFAVQREDAPEEFVLTNLNGLLPTHTYEKIRINLVLYDTETNNTRGFSALVMFDQAAEPGRMVTLYSSQGGAGNWASAEYLRKLRDEVDRQIQLLEENGTE